MTCTHVASAYTAIMEGRERLAGTGHLEIMFIMSAAAWSCLSAIGSCCIGSCFQTTSNE